MTKDLLGNLSTMIDQSLFVASDCWETFLCSKSLLLSISLSVLIQEVPCHSSQCFFRLLWGKVMVVVHLRVCTGCASLQARVWHNKSVPYHSVVGSKIDKTAPKDWWYTKKLELANTHLVHCLILIRASELHWALWCLENLIFVYVHLTKILSVVELAVLIWSARITFVGFNRKMILWPDWWKLMDHENGHTLRSNSKGALANSAGSGELSLFI